MTPRWNPANHCTDPARPLSLPASSAGSQVLRDCKEGVGQALREFELEKM